MNPPIVVNRTDAAKWLFGTLVYVFHSHITTSRTCGVHTPLRPCVLAALGLVEVGAIMVVGDLN